MNEWVVFLVDIDAVRDEWGWGPFTYDEAMKFSREVRRPKSYAQPVVALRENYPDLRLRATT